MPDFLISTVGAAIIYVIMLLFFIKKKTKKKDSSYVSANGFIPLIGHTLQFLPEKFLSTLMDYPKRYGDVVEFYLGPNRMLLISNLELAHEVMLRRPNKFQRWTEGAYASEVSGISRGLFETHGSHWSHLRRATAPFFSAHNIEKKFDTIHQTLTQWFQGIEQRAQKENNEESEKYVYNMKFEVFSFTIRIITLMAFGLEETNPIQQYFFSKQFMDDIFAIFEFQIQYRMFPFKGWWTWSSGYRQYELPCQASCQRMQSHAKALLEYKKQCLWEKQEQPKALIDYWLVKEQEETQHQPQDVAVSLWANNHQQESQSSPSSSSSTVFLSDEDFIANILTIYIAGADTSSIILTYATYTLATQPEIAQKVYEEARKQIEVNHHLPADWSMQFVMTSLPYCLALVKELLRLYGPGFAAPLELEENIDKVQLTALSKEHPVIVDAKTTVWLNFEYLNKEASVFEDPLMIIPERWLTASPEKLKKMERSFVAFGGGPHICPGMYLALAEITMALAMMGYRLQFQLACPPEEIQRLVLFIATPNKMPMYMKLRETSFL
jgi:cytochrome P450